MFGSDCRCREAGRGQGAESMDSHQKWLGHADRRPLIAGQCMARSKPTALKPMTSPTIFRQIAWENGTKLYKIQ
jgi:hypothetical protein